MISKIFSWVNLSFLAGVALVGMVYLMRSMVGPSPVSPPPIEALKVPDADLLKNAFAQSPEAYDRIGPPVIVTAWYVPALELPDLRPYLQYHGTNDRPDNPTAAIRLFFSLRGTEGVTSVEPGKPQYLRYDATKKPGNYIFSPDNQPTKLWIEAQRSDGKAEVTVHMRDESGRSVAVPASRATLSLPARDYVRPGAAWEIGKFKVDGTLLARQRARWFGQDQFLNRHGGEEFGDVVGRERIEFGEGDDRYAIYVKAGDSIIWDGQRWSVVQPGEASRGFPLMSVQKVEDRLMRLDLWDVGGQSHVVLNLVKSREAWTPKTYERDFKFISSRTLSQYVFEIKNNRVVLRPFDWYLLTPEGWKPVVSVDEIDAYVTQKAPGVLFIFNGPAQADGKNVLKATLFSPARTETFEMEYPLDQASSILGGQTTGEPKVEKPPESPDKAKSTEEPSKGATFEEIPPKVEKETPPVESTEHPQTIEEAQIKARAEEIEKGALESMHPLDTNEYEVPESTTNQEEEQIKEEEVPPHVSEEDEPVQQRLPRRLYREQPARHITDLAPPMPNKRIPGQLRDDIRYLLQDNSK